MEPPTPQSTSLTTKTVIPPIAVPASASPLDSTAESDTGPSGGVSDRSTELHKQRLERRKRKKRHPPDARGMTSSCRFLSTLVTSRIVVAGPVAAGGHQLHSSSESLIQAPAAQLPAAAPDSVRSFGSMTGRSLKQTRSSSVTSARRSQSLTRTPAHAVTSPLAAVAGALLDSDDIKGVVISAPDGEIVKVGESYATGDW